MWRYWLVNVSIENGRSSQVRKPSNWKRITLDRSCGLVILKKSWKNRKKMRIYRFDINFRLRWINPWQIIRLKDRFKHCPFKWYRKTFFVSEDVLVMIKKIAAEFLKYIKIFRTALRLHENRCFSGLLQKKREKLTDRPRRLSPCSIFEFQSSKSFQKGIWWKHLLS